MIDLRYPSFLFDRFLSTQSVSSPVFAHQSNSCEVFRVESDKYKFFLKLDLLKFLDELQLMCNLSVKLVINTDIKRLVSNN